MKALQGPQVLNIIVFGLTWLSQLGSKCSRTNGVNFPTNPYSTGAARNLNNEAEHGEYKVRFIGNLRS